MNKQKVFLFICIMFWFGASAVALAEDIEPGNISIAATLDAGDKGKIEAAFRVFYKENPWLFIQKTLVEWPNDALMSRSALFFDALCLGLGVGGSAFVSGGLSKGKDSFFELFIVFLLASFSGVMIKNYIHKKIATSAAWEAFLINYKRGCRDYTPPSLQPFFDELIKTKIFQKIEKARDGNDLSMILADFPLEILYEVKKAIEEHNPAFKVEDNIHRKIKYFAAALGAVILIRAVDR